MRCQLVESLFEVIRSFAREEGTARDYGEGILLYHSEVTLLEAIERNPEKSASALADTLGITRGALTQTARKLMDKGLVEQYDPPKNRKVKYHRLTELGERVRAKHMQFHEASNGRIKAYLCTRTPEEKQVLSEFFDQLRECMPICLYECERLGCNCNLSMEAAEAETKV